MSIPKEPRQQMINMMYLVLTALLALNISAEILNAFYLVRDGIAGTISAIDQKNDVTYQQINTQFERNPEKAQAAYDKSREAQRIADELYQYIEATEKRIIDESGGYDPEKPEEKILIEPKNLDTPTNVMLNQKEGDKLQAEINNTRKKFIDLLGISEDNPFAQQLSLKAEDPPKSAEHGSRSWAEKNFQMVPAVAVSTMMAAFKNSVRNTEADVINRLLSSIGSSDIKVDQMSAQVIATSSYITLGQEYKADIFASAYSSTLSPDIFIGQFDPALIPSPDDSLPLVFEDKNPLKPGYDSLDVVAGKGKYTVKPSREGDHKYQGVIKVLNESTGVTNYYPFKGEYLAAAGTVVVSPDNLNVVYAGIDNPISISVPGFPAEKIRPAISKGSLKPNPEKKGGYIVSGLSFAPNSKIAVNVSVQTEEGVRGIGGPAEFRVKRVPDPIAAINGTVTEGPVKTGVIKNVPGIGAVLKDFDFKGVNFRVTSFQAVYIPKRQDPVIIENKGWKFTGKLSKRIKGSKPGDQLIFRKIKAKGPDGSTRNLNSIPLEIK